MGVPRQVVLAGRSSVTIPYREDRVLGPAAVSSWATTSWSRGPRAVSAHASAQGAEPDHPSDSESDTSLDRILRDSAGVEDSEAAPGSLVDLSYDAEARTCMTDIHARLAGHYLSATFWAWHWTWWTTFPTWW